MSARNQRPARGSGATYRFSAYTRLLTWQVRERRFKPVRLGRRGLDPDDVYAFLDRVAGDLAAVHADLAANRRCTPTTTAPAPAASAADPLQDGAVRDVAVASSG